MSDSEEMQQIHNNAVFDDSGSDATSSSSDEDDMEKGINDPSPLAESDQDDQVQLDPKINPVLLTFENMSYTVQGGFAGPKALFKRQNPFAKPKKEILHPMTGHFLPGRMVAIMGPSGAGKTTFLNTLAGRAKTGKIKGDIKVNGKKFNSEKFKKYSAYVMQEDTLLGNLTPKELLYYAARLRLPRSMSRKEKDQRVDEIIKKLGLSRCQNTRVGIPGVSRGISGGERRRVSMGLELITNPTLLFLDEPTSGLDSATSENVVQILKNLAREGRTIICTIHQPSSEIFAAFDDLFLLADGNLAYSGPISEVTDYFAGLGHPCPRYTNPADHVMRLMARKPDGDEEEYQARCQQAVDYRADHNNIVSLDTVKDLDLTKKPKAVKDKPRFYTVFWYLFTRSWKQYIRDPGVTFGRLMSTLFVALFTGLLFLQLGHSQTDVIGRQGALFVSLMFCVFQTGSSVLYIFPLERPNFLREYANGMFPVWAYYLSKSTADTPFQIAFPAMFGTIVYWLAGLRMEAGAFFVFLAFIIMIANIAQSIGFLVSIFTDLQVALGLFPVTVIPLLLVGGLFLNVDDIPDYLVWLQYLSYFYYSFSGMLVNEFEDVHFHCTGDQYVGPDNNRVCPTTNGNQLIDSLSFNKLRPYQCGLVLVGMYVVLRLFAYLGLVWLAKKKSSS
eukprot:TRINITY_DN551_c0_g1_i1.p1 TRINITY_DN551_c0_g1~~TRINITY_DN551_c0_g1_i1.p1  ORF type:complete len:671 (+),score=117.28 TRINITY_DN551_c0_g1_i1:236-2248(+)